MISAVVLTKNSEKTLTDCLESLSFCREIIIIDDYSEDKTPLIAKKYKAKFFKRHLSEDYSSQRNFGLKKASNNWVLFLDSDEVVTPTIKKEILRNVKKQGKTSGFFIRRKAYIWNRQIMGGEFGETQLLRLGKKQSGKWVRKVHEYWNIKDTGQILKGYILHKPDFSVKNFLVKLNNYSDIHAEENIKESKKSSVFKVIFMPLGKFVSNFILKSGFKDGMHGVILAYLMSFHSFLSWSKIYIEAISKPRKQARF